MKSGGLILSLIAAAVAVAAVIWLVSGRGGSRRNNTPQAPSKKDIRQLRQQPEKVKKKLDALMKKHKKLIDEKVKKAAE